MADVADATTASWIQAGGVIAFASAVLWQLRDLKPVLKEVVATLTEVKTTLAALLERERARAERLAAMDAQREHHRAATNPGAIPLSQWDELTGPIADVGRAQTPPIGTPTTAIGRYGPMKPKGG